VTDPGQRGQLITFEGIDGCGKSTQAALLRDACVAAGLEVGHPGAPGALLREPGGTPAGEIIRALLLEGTPIAPWPEALLYAAARAQLVEEVLRPALSAGWLVILDRYIDSSLAYQGHARGLGIERVAELNGWATGGLLPDLTVIIDLSPERAAQRRADRPDRIEEEGLAFQHRVAEGYALAAERAPERVRVVDGDRPADQVAADVRTLVGDCLGVGALLGTIDV
jgi:dTMP kinase